MPKTKKTFFAARSNDIKGKPKTSDESVSIFGDEPMKSGDGFEVSEHPIDEFASERLERIVGKSPSKGKKIKITVEAEEVD